MDKKRIISFLLALVMLLGTLANPVFAISSNPNRGEEAKYEIQEIGGKTYKAYKVSDLGLKNPEKLLTPKYRTRAAGDPMEDWVKIKIQSSTVGLTLGDDFNVEVFVAIRKLKTKIAVAKINPTQEKVKDQIFHFVKTAEYDENNEDHKNPDKWYLYVEDDFKYDIRLKYGERGNFGDENMLMIISQRAMPLYKAVWFTNNQQRPVVDAIYNDGDNIANSVKLNTTDFAENEYKSFSSEKMPFTVAQKEVIVKEENLGSMDKEKFLVSDMKGAALWKLLIDQNGEKKTQGFIEDGATKYHFNITGDYKTPFVATMRQELKVKFDPNGAKFDQAVKTEQAIGHSMKIGEAFGDLEAVTVPTNKQISNIPKKDNKDQELVGWVTKKADKDLDFSNGQNAVKLVDPNGYEVKDNVTFYAVYAPKAQGKVAIQYVDKEGNPIKDKYKVQGVDYPRFAEGNKDEDVDAESIPQPAFIGYERSGDIVVTGKKYDENGRFTVEVPYKKLDSIIPEDNASDDVKKTYTPVTFAADTSKGKLKLGDADGGAEKVYYVNPVEGKTIENVRAKDNITAEGTKDVYKVDGTTPWTFVPDEVSSLNTVITTTAVTVNANFVKENGKVVYEYKYENKTSITDPSKTNIPAVPTDNAEYEVEATVNAETTVAKDKIIPVRDNSGTLIGSWKFSGWEPATLKIKKGENKFTGTWTFTESLASILKGKLSPQDIKVWKNDDIDWKKGVSIDENGLTSEQKYEIRKARFEDQSGRNSGTASTNPFIGNIKVTFSDGSELLVKDQKLYVSEEMTNKDNENAPKDAITVTFKLGNGVKAMKGETEIKGAQTPAVYETYKVKPNTNLDNYKLSTNKNIFDNINPQVTDTNKFKNVVWNPTNHVVTMENNTFTANATESFIMKHTFKLLDKDNNNAEITVLPQVLNDKLPEDKTKAKGETYTPDKLEPIKEVKEGDNFYDYTFENWDPTSAVNEDKTFTGTWTREQSQSNKPIVKEPVKPGAKEITGKGKPGSEIKVKIPNPQEPNNPTEKTTTVGDDGTWKVEIPEAKKGDKYIVTQTEKGKKISEEVTVEVKEPTPSRPSTPSTPSRPSEPTKPEGDRVHGKDRVETAIEISKKYFRQANTVIVVDRKDFPDAMTASVLSKILKAPILLTDTHKLDPRVAAEIQRLGAKDVIVVGGNKSVSEAVKKELAKFDKDTVERIYGRDRYETSAQVARRVVGITGKLGHGVVASGEVFADALAVSPYASREGYPILLVRANNLPKSVKDAITELAINKVTIAGGYTTVNKSLEASLPTVAERLSGRTRYETAIDIATKKFNTNKIFLANGEHWMDALVIGPVGGILDMPILLTQANSAPQSLKDYIAKSNIEKITAIGGTSMVSDRVLNELSK